MKHADWMCREPKRPSNALQLAREIGSWPIYTSDTGHKVMVSRRSLTKDERDLITNALRAYDKDT